jgi:hypothetical protein
MARGDPKQVFSIRLDRTMVDEVRRCTETFTVAVEEGLALWLKRELRRRERGAAEPSARERAVRGRGKAA